MIQPVKPQTLKPYIVADIGGTNARFGLVTQCNDSQLPFVIEHQNKFPSNQFRNISEATLHFIDTLPINIEEIDGACLALAGPVIGDDARSTNLNWQFSIKKVKNKLGLNHLTIINDFSAYAYATPLVPTKHLLQINKGNAEKTCPIAIVGPGTGFGVAALMPNGDKYIVLPTEGGHMSISAITDLQKQIIETLKKEFSHISVESILSGPGLRNIYRALALVEGITTPQLGASQITAQALIKPSSLSYRTLRLFCQWLGQTTGDLALSLGARGGIFLGGGILPRFTEFLLASEFMTGYSNKGKLQDYVNGIPINLITEGNSALLGAASWYQHHGRND
ncbi:MAG: glucokinase [Kangiella sp.]|nr:MAG: glucokinase [Kangiella sp.]